MMTNRRLATHALRRLAQDCRDAAADRNKWNKHTKRDKLKTARLADELADRLELGLPLDDDK